MAKEKKSGGSRKRTRAMSETAAAEEQEHEEAVKVSSTTKQAPTEKRAKAARKAEDMPADHETTPPPTMEMESMVAEPQFRRATTEKRMTNRQKCLVLGGRSMSSKDRHLLNDLRGLMAHAREHAKLGRTQRMGDDLIELCGLHQCNSLLFLDPHRSDVTYVWLAQAPSGPSMKLQLANVHTADEVRMAGNCLKYSRPLLHFDRDFELQPHLRVAKALLHTVFNIPRYHPRSKPFVDRIMSFFWLDGHIWVRNYQIVPSDPVALMEIGPRFTLEPVAIFNGCCKGNVLWRSGEAKAPTEQRRDRKLRRLEKMQGNEVIKSKSEKHRALHPVPPVDPLDQIFKD